MNRLALILILLCGCATPPTNTTRVLLAAQSRSQPEGIAATITVSTEAHVQWLPLTVDHYNLYYGTAPGAYVASVSTDTTNAFVEGLSGWTTYYFAVTSVDTNGVESDFSTEAGLRPSLLLHFPEPGTGLEASRDLMTWTARDAQLTNGVWRVTASNDVPQEFFRTVIP
jgi:hypothetical protein